MTERRRILLENRLADWTRKLVVYKEMYATNLLWMGRMRVSGTRDDFLYEMYDVVIARERVLDAYMRLKKVKHMLGID